MAVLSNSVPIEPGSASVAEKASGLRDWLLEEAPRIEAEKRIPEEIAVVGCGNLSYSNFLRVPLSSVDQGSEMIGKQAAQMALKLVDEKGARCPLNKLINLRLISRASSSRNSQAYPPCGALTNGQPAAR